MRSKQRSAVWVEARPARLLWSLHIWEAGSGADGGYRSHSTEGITLPLDQTYPLWILFIILSSPSRILAGKNAAPGLPCGKGWQPLSGNHKYLEFEVDWELNKIKLLKKLKFGNKLARPWIPWNAFDRHCIKADLFARLSEKWWLVGFFFFPFNVIKMHFASWACTTGVRAGYFLCGREKC